MKKLAVLALGVLVVACSETPTESPTMDSPRLAAGGGGGGVVARASGAGILTWDSEVIGLFGSEPYGFNVTQLADGSVKGQLHTDWRETETDGPLVHMELDCLDVQGNMAFLGATITRLRTPNPSYPLAVGDRFVWWIEDNGQGVDADPDRIGLLYPVTTETCEDEFPQYLLYDLFVVQYGGYGTQTAGNIQIDTY